MWTQDPAISADIAAASRIPAVVDHPEQMLEVVDGLLLARDDAENHPAFAMPVLEAGLAVYIDKPLALNPAGAAELLARERWPGQLFSCSALRYARELRPAGAALASVRAEIGALQSIDACAPKSWARYGMHAIEPVVALLAELGFGAQDITHVTATGHGEGGRRVSARVGEEITLRLSTSGGQPSPIAVTLTGDRGARTFTFTDAFAAFRSALAAFIQGIHEQRATIPREQTRLATEILAWGL